MSPELRLALELGMGVLILIACAIGDYVNSKEGRYLDEN